MTRRFKGGVEDNPAPLADLHDDQPWTRYLITWAALGAKPVSAERARELVANGRPAIGDAMRRECSPQTKH
jgi:hypothetical protein